MIVQQILKGSFIAALTVFAFTQLGCKAENSQEPPAKTPLAPVTNLRAFSGTQVGSIGLRWTSSVDITKSDHGEIQITTKDGNTVFSILNVPKFAVDTAVRGLVEGTTYTFEVVVKATANSSNIRNSDPAIIQWAPSRRLVAQSGNEILAYETSDGARHSGLILYHPSVQEPRTISVSNPVPAADSLLIDLYIQTEDNNAVSLMSANRYGIRDGTAGKPTWRRTLFSTEFQNVETLDDPRPAPPDTNSYLAGNTERRIDSVSVSTSRIYYFRGNNGNYGRILVKRNPATGRLIWGTSPGQYVKLEISYQTRANNPFSKPVSLDLDGEKAPR